MIPSGFKESNCVFDKPSNMTYDDCYAIEALKGTLEGINVPAVITCWKLTQEELDEINKTGRVWLIVYGTGMPPVTISGIKPFRTE